MIGWLALFGGIAYGYFSPGRQNLKELLKKGLLYGIVIAVVLAILATFLNFSLLGMGRGIIANIVGAVIVVLMFVGGVWLGDWLEHRKHDRRTV